MKSKKENLDTNENHTNSSINESITPLNNSILKTSSKLLIN